MAETLVFYSSIPPKRLTLPPTGSQVKPEVLSRDPEDRLLSRDPRFRLGAEMLRDQRVIS